jgi:hypothetical protein
MKIQTLIKKLPTALQPLGQQYAEALSHLIDDEVDYMLKATTAKQTRIAYTALLRVLPTEERDAIQRRITADIRLATKRRALQAEVQRQMIAEAIRVLVFAGKMWMGLP